MALANVAIRQTQSIPSRPIVSGIQSVSTPRTVSPGLTDSVRFSKNSQTKGAIPATGLALLPSQANKAENPLLTTAQRKLMNTPAFSNVYRNFDLLNPSQQQASLQKLELFVKKYPQFLDILNQIPNPRYGDGFQFFFIPPEDNTRWKDIPEGVRGMGGSVNYSGIVYSSPAFSLIKSDSKLKTALHTLSQGVVDAVSAVKPGRVALDVGGMFTDSSEDTFSHEMGHILNAYFMSNAEQLELWAIYTDADQSNKGFLTDYSRTNHMEFFAEGVESYFKQDTQGNFIERDQFQQTNPRLYAFVRKLLEPGVSATAPDALNSALTVTRGKAKDAAQAIKHLFQKAP